MVFLCISRLHVGWLNYDPLLILAPLTRDNAFARCTLIPSSSASLHSPVYMYAFEGPKPATRGGVNVSRSKFLPKFKPSAYIPKITQSLKRSGQSLE